MKCCRNREKRKNNQNKAAWLISKVNPLSFQQISAKIFLKAVFHGRY
jgi:hypothetical protein